MSSGSTALTGGRYTQAEPLSFGGLGHFRGGKLFRSKDPQLLPGLALQELRLGNAIMGSDANLFGYAAAMFKVCAYVGVCVGTVSHDMYLTAGYVEVPADCWYCSPLCFYETESNTVMEPKKFECVPPMPIVKWSRESPGKK